MTPRNYQSIGRAVVLAAELAKNVGALYQLRSRFENELAKVVGLDAAQEIHRALMTDRFVEMRLGDIVASIVTAARARYGEGEK